MDGTTTTTMEQRLAMYESQLAHLTAKQERMEAIIHHYHQQQRQQNERGA